MSESDSGPSDAEHCSNCGGVIDEQPLYKSSDTTLTENGLEFVENPDGPFCDTDCRRAYDGE